MLKGGIMENLLSVSISDLNRHGLLNPNTRRAVKMFWTLPDGTRWASMVVVTDTTFEVATVRFVYEESNGKVHDERVLLYWKRSNLNANHGFYYFACPVSGRACRNLYLVGGRFISRYAFRALYRSQTTKDNEQPRVTLSECEDIQPTPTADVEANEQKARNKDLAAVLTRIQNGGTPTAQETPK